MNESPMRTSTSRLGATHVTELATDRCTSLNGIQEMPCAPDMSYAAS